MSERFSGAGFNSQIYDEACVWFVEMRSGDVDAAGRQRFNVWVRKSPEHLRAYLEISEIWDDARLMDKTGCGSSEDLVAKARAGAEVVLFEGASTSRRMPEAAPPLRTRLAAHRLAAAAAVGVIACGLAA